MKVPLTSRERKGASSRVAGDARIIHEKMIAHPRLAKWQYWEYHCTYLGNWRLIDELKLLQWSCARGAKIVATKNDCGLQKSWRSSGPLLFASGVSQHQLPQPDIDIVHIITFATQYFVLSFETLN
jgi:hypothetical protein